MRIFHKSGSTVTEFTEEVRQYANGTKSLTLEVGDYLYIASDFPMNHLYFKIDPVVVGEEDPAPLVGAMSVDYWSAESWAPVVNMVDQTDGLALSGFVDFTPNRDSSWTRSSTNYSGDSIDGLESITVYDMYWTRISLDEEVAISFEWIGHLFSDDYDLFGEYPIFNDSNFLNGFATGKTDWQEQHVKAGELIIQDLKRKNIIFGAEQILDRQVLMPASVSKTAEILFSAFGRDYFDFKANAKNDYDKRMDLSKFVVDTNNNAIKEPHEIQSSVGWLSR